MRFIMGFLKPDAGRIVAGEDITDFLEDGLNRIHKRVTMVFQNGALLDSLTVRENVAFPLRERDDLEEKQIRETVDEFLGMVGARDSGPLARRYFHRYEAIDRNCEGACGQPKASLILLGSADLKIGKTQRWIREPSIRFVRRTARS